jgi:hypothetical protein
MVRALWWLRPTRVVDVREGARISGRSHTAELEFNSGFHNDTVVASAVIMMLHTMKTCFAYQVNLGCGLPCVTL